MAVLVDDFGDTAHGVLEHVVGLRESFFLGDVIAQHFQQLFVQHHNQRVDIGFQLGQAAIGVLHAAATFPLKGLGHHAHGQNAHLLGHARDHGCRTGASTAAHAGRDEQHVRPFDRSTDVFHGGFRGFTPLVGLAASTQTAQAQLDGAVRVAADQCLRIGVGADEFNALHIASNHVLNGVAAAAAHTDHLDLRALIECFGFDHFDGHVGAPGDF